LLCDCLNNVLTTSRVMLEADHTATDECKIKRPIREWDEQGNGSIPQDLSAEHTIFYVKRLK
jgi:hypothetical protein